MDRRRNNLYQQQQNDAYYQQQQQNAYYQQQNAYQQQQQDAYYQQQQGAYQQQQNAYYQQQQQDAYYQQQQRNAYYQQQRNNISEAEAYYEQFEYKSNSVLRFMRNTAHLIRSFIVAIIILVVIFGYMFFFTDIEFKYDPRDKGPVTTTESTVSGGYNDDI